MVIEQRKVITVEEPYRSDGLAYWIQTTKAPMLDRQGNVTGVVVIFEDITQRKLDAEDARRRTWALEALRLGGKALIFSGSEAEMIQRTCEAITHHDAYALAWFGWAIDDQSRSIDIVSSAGNAHGYLDGFKVGWGDTALGNGPSGTAVRTGKTQVNNDADHNQQFSPWMSRAKQHGIGSSISLPIKLDGERVSAVFTVYAKEPLAFGNGEVSLFEELAANLSYGIQSRRIQIAYESSVKIREQQGRILEKSLEDALMAISSTLEYRDPYTAGHQKHVGDLAVKIGQKLQLDDTSLHGLYLAAIVHDIGKIQVPTEILTKPMRLNETEFNLIKIHPEVGYNILSKIDFPWPIAEIIRQHHEYLDGSGYPRGLAGDEILYEARILTVADIIESMSSDRPYRPALGMKVAIEQIQAMSGTKLDKGIVDACIAVLEGGDFTPNSLHL